MRDARGARIALEAAFLIAVAAVLAAAEVEPAWIVLVMLLAWLVVALLEWAAWREEPHWSSGSPPRYYVPPERLPPRRPGRELPAFSRYPRPLPRETEAPTWIAPPEMRDELLRWPAPVDTDTEEEDVLVEPGAVAVEETEPEPGWPLPAEPEQDGVPDPWVVEELPVVPGADTDTEPEADAEPTPVPVVHAVVAAPDAVAAPPRDLPRATHRIDPYAEPQRRRRRFRRHVEDVPEALQFPSLPHHIRMLAGDAARVVRQ